LKDPAKIWRQYAPPGLEAAFDVVAARYRGQDFGHRVAESIERSHDWESWIDKCIRRVIRMRRARMGGVSYKIINKLMLSQAVGDATKIKRQVVAPTVGDWYSVKWAISFKGRRK
jgi:hypothetical protein